MILLQLCRLQSNDLPAVRISAIWTAAEAGKMPVAPIWPPQNICHTAQLCKSECTHA